jgi:hypothetical protein
VSGKRYDRYKHCTTFSEVHDLCEQGIMHGSTKRRLGLSGDLNYDFCMGHVRLVPLDQINGTSTSGKTVANGDAAKDATTAEMPNNTNHQPTSTPAAAKKKPAQKVRRSRRIAAALITRFAGASVRALKRAVVAMSRDRAKEISKKKLVNAILDIPSGKAAGGGASSGQRPTRVTSLTKTATRSTRRSRTTREEQRSITAQTK